jgi:hypothetical protein
MSASTTFFYLVVNGAPTERTYRTKSAAIKHAQWIVRSASGQQVEVIYYDRVSRQESAVKFTREA